MNEGEQKKMAQIHNIRAAKIIVDTVKSTLGPMGMDKMLVDGGGNVIVTNDGATILRELDVAHPGGKMMVEVAKTQEILCYDGTTSTVVLAGQLLTNSELLFEKGLHPNVICRGYHEAAQMATKYLIKKLSNSKRDNKTLMRIARTAITGKTLENALDKVAELCVNAIKNAGDVDNVKIISLAGGSLEESYWFAGSIVNKDYVIEMDLSEETNILLINTGLEPEKNEENIQVSLDADSYASFKTSSKDDMLSSAKLITKALPHGGIVFVRDGVHDHICSYLKKQNIAIVRRLPESTLRSLSKTLKCGISQTPDEVNSSSLSTFKREKHNDVWYLFVRGEENNGEGTLVLRGATTHTLEETERGFDDALGVVSLVIKHGNFVYGGGSSYVAMASHLRQHAASIGGRAQMAIEAFADALEVIPATIAENAGHDSLDTVLAMRNKVLNNEFSYGPDVTNGGLTDMAKLGVYVPTELIRQAVLSASEVSIAILRIDDIVSRKTIE